MQLDLFPSLIKFELCYQERRENWYFVASRGFLLTIFLLILAISVNRTIIHLSIQIKTLGPFMIPSRVLSVRQSSQFYYQSIILNLSSFLLLFFCSLNINHSHCLGRYIIAGASCRLFFCQFGSPVILIAASLPEHPMFLPSVHLFQPQSFIHIKFFPLPTFVPPPSTCFRFCLFVFSMVCLPPLKHRHHENSALLELPPTHPVSLTPGIGSA